MKTITLILVFILTFLISFPKNKVYELVLDNLAKYDVSIVSQDKDISSLGIELDNNNIYLSGAKIAKVSKIDFEMYRIKANNIRFSGSFKQMLPSIEEALVYIKLGDFLNVTGKFGTIVGNLDISNKKIILTANITSNMYNKYRNVFKIFKKSKDTKGYIYEFNF